MKRAKLKNTYRKKKKKTTMFGLVFLLICFFCGFFLNQFNKKITPKLLEIATKNIEKITYNMFNNYSILAEMDKNALDNILKIQKNKKDEIINVSYDMKKAYNLANTLASKIKKDFQSLENGTQNLEYYDEDLSRLEDGLILTMPIGLASNSAYFANLGPKIPVKIKFVGTLLTNLKTKIQNYGINNILIEVYIDVSLTHEIISPITYRTNDLKYEILIGAEVISGAVPSYYGGLYETKSNILNVPLE